MTLDSRIQRSRREIILQKAGTLKARSSQKLLELEEEKTKVQTKKVNMLANRAYDTIFPSMPPIQLIAFAFLLSLYS